MAIKTTDPKPATKGGSLPTSAELKYQVAKAIHETMPDGSRNPVPFDALGESGQAEIIAEAEAVMQVISKRLVFPLWVDAMLLVPTVKAHESLEQAGEILTGAPMFTFTESE
jgi:hypothetical protein